MVFVLLLLLFSVIILITDSMACGPDVAHQGRLFGP